MASSLIKCWQRRSLGLGCVSVLVVWHQQSLRHRRLSREARPELAVEPSVQQHTTTTPWPGQPIQLSLLVAVLKKSKPQSPSQAARLIGRRWSPFLQRSARNQFTLPDHGYGAGASRGVPVYVPAFAGTHRAYPRMDGQAELNWVTSYMPRLFTRMPTITHTTT